MKKFIILNSLPAGSTWDAKTLDLKSDDDAASAASALRSELTLLRDLHAEGLLTDSVYDERQHALLDAVGASTHSNGTAVELRQVQMAAPIYDYQLLCCNYDRTSDPGNNLTCMDPLVRNGAKTGWQPLGGPYGTGSCQPVCSVCQAMVKYKLD